MSDAEERIKEIMERRKKEAQAHVQHQVALEQAIKTSSAQNKINKINSIGQMNTSAVASAAAILGASGDASREQWLEKTQHMRVVALNEACEIAKTFIGHGEPMATREITSMASLFAKFLVDDKA
jgi:hypothetical protein